MGTFSVAKHSEVSNFLIEKAKVTFFNIVLNACWSELNNIMWFFIALHFIQCQLGFHMTAPLPACH